MSRVLALCLSLSACGTTEGNAVRVASVGVARAGPLPAAEGACSATDLDKLVRTVLEASGDVRLNLMVAGLKTACPTMEPGLLTWIAALDDAGSPPEATALRHTRCPKGDDLWGAPAQDWGAWSNTVWDRCALGNQTVLTRAELAGGMGPEAGLLGIALHDHLQSSHPEHARTLGRWVAGHPPDPNTHLSRRRYGAFGQAAPIALLGSLATRAPSTGCVPVLALTPDSLSVDQAMHSLDTLGAALAPCSAMPAFRGKLLVAVQPDTAALRLVETLQAAGAATDASAELLVRMGRPVGEAVIPAHDARVAVRTVTWSADPMAAPSSTGGAPKSAAKGKSSSKASKSGAGTFRGGGMIGGGGGSHTATPVLHLTGDVFALETDGTSGVGASGSMADLPAALGGLEKPGEVLEVRVSADVSYALLMEVLEVVQGTDDAGGKPTGPFPFVRLGIAKR